LQQDDGRIVVVAYSTSVAANGVKTPVILRYTSTGQLDTTYGASGVTVVQLGPQDYTPVGASLDTRGGVYGLAVAVTNVSFFLFRLNDQGVPDAQFGAAGKVYFSADTFSTSTPRYRAPILSLFAMTATADGGIALAGYHDYMQFTNCCYLYRGLV